MSLPRMSLHIGDYKKDTGHLRAAGHGAYLLLIMHYWATGGLPDDDKQLAAIACMTVSEWKKLRPIIRPLFGDGWSHKRIDAELAAAQAKYEKRALAGAKGGGAPRRTKQNGSNAPAKAEQPITDNPLVVGEGDARARDPSADNPTDDDIALARSFLIAIGQDAESPLLLSVAYTAVMWRQRGYERAAILATGAELAARGESYPMSYYFAAIVRRHEDRDRAQAQAPPSTGLPVIAISASQGHPHETARRPRHQRSPITAAIDDLVERLTGEVGGGSEAREAPPRMLSHG